MCVISVHLFSAASVGMAAIVGFIKRLFVGSDPVIPAEGRSVATEAKVVEIVPKPVEDDKSVIEKPADEPKVAVAEEKSLAVEGPTVVAAEEKPAAVEGPTVVAAEEKPAAVEEKPVEAEEKPVAAEEESELKAVVDSNKTGPSKKKHKKRK